MNQAALAPTVRGETPRTSFTNCERAWPAPLCAASRSQSRSPAPIAYSHWTGRESLGFDNLKEVVEVYNLKDVPRVPIDANHRDSVRQTRTQCLKLVKKRQVNVRDLYHVDRHGAIVSPQTAPPGRLCRQYKTRLLDVRGDRPQMRDSCLGRSCRGRFGLVATPCRT